MPLQAITNFYQAIIDKNAPAILGHYMQSEETYVILEGPRLATLGFSKIQKGWIDFCSSGLQLKSIQWEEGPFEEKTRSMAWVAGVIRLEVEVNGRAFANTFRASFVLRRQKGQWLIRHEHVSGALADPYGIGDWLKSGGDG